MLDLKAIPVDPILGLIAAHRDDPNPKKIDLGVGVYKDEAGNTPILDTVKEAEARRIATETTKTYLGPPGVAGFNQAIGDLVFGSRHDALSAGRIRTVQTPGGTAALRVAADLIRRAHPDATIWVSDPTWANHNALFPAAGLKLKPYPYFDKEKSALRAEAMLESIAQRGPGDVVLLHGCCHNPCGVDLEREHWEIVADLALEKGFLPMVDLAYQGFGDGVDDDAYGPRLLADKVPELIVASSCSKNFGLYRERCGAIAVMGKDAESAAAIESVIHTVTRGLYSMPPAHGPAIVDIILHDDELTARWLEELQGMRERIAGLRRLVNEKIQEHGITRDFSFIERQRGMFSFLGISVDQVRRLRNEFSIYMVDSARINIAGFSTSNVDYFAASLAKVLKVQDTS